MLSLEPRCKESGWGLGFVNTTNLVILLLAVANLAQICVGLFLMLSIRNARHRRDAAVGASQEKYSIILASIANLAKTRTGLSRDLLKLAEGKDIDDSHEQAVSKFLREACDNLRSALTSYTNSSCTVSVKIISPKETESKNFYVRTVARDAHSAVIRSNVYENIEPYEFKSHYLISKLVLSDPQSAYTFENDLQSLGDEYRNPMHDWHRFFNASAIHLISDPSSELNDSVYGFLMVDNIKGGFDNGPVRHIMETYSVMLYFVLRSAVAIKAIMERKAMFDV